MSIDKKAFNQIVKLHGKGYDNSKLAQMFKLNERTIRRVIEAGTWQRWPYIQAKKQYGYMTPEYKAHLNKQGLPLHPPKAKTAKSNKSLIERFKAWIHYPF